ncbi:MAG: asparagine synthase (glutamine-hydrolyzing) [Vicinamibacteria bacterium]
MCGIAGLVEAPGRSPDRGVLEAMGGALRHRGPDDGTVESWGRAGFAFRRLSIIDVAGGRQPIANEDETCRIVLNGEIYNHLDLRADLERRGHRFRTRSDVEAVLHGYEEWGDEVVTRLRGMFAFAIWDERQQRLLLARDRLGKKPLVYRESGGRLAFASELQGLLADPSLERRPDLEAIHHYLTYQYVPAPWTAFEGVRKLPPAHRLVFENGAGRVERYWSLAPRPESGLDLEQAAAEVRRLLRDAVKVRLMSEVPLGAFLSGGVDSSAVVALMSEFGRVKTFSIGFEEAEFDELRYARLVAERYGTDHHELVVRPDAAEVLPRLVEHFGEPFADSSAIPTYYVAKLAREHVTVALNGDGGDELFAGYDRYRALGVYERLSRVPAGRSLGLALASLGGSGLPSRARRLLEAIAADPEESYARTISYFAPEAKLALYRPELRERLAATDSHAVLREHFRAWNGRDLVARTLHADTLTYLPGDLLAKVDIATMAVSLEGRSPLLDHPLVELAGSLPSHLKLAGRQGKRVLRRAVEDLLPPAILTRPKMGFGVPIARWLRAELRPLAEDALLASGAATRELFEPAAIARIWREHQSGARDRSPQLWALLCLELWWRQFLGTAARSSARR